MSPLSHEDLTCAVCGQIASRVLLQGSNTIEPPDFDTRPGEMMRSTLYYWVMECPHCGYAAPDIRESDARAAGIVRSDLYGRRRTDEALPEDARRFTCYAHLLEQLEQYADAGWTALHAAWLCDDRGNPAAARHCRAEAIRLWKQGKANGDNFMEEHQQEFALVTDVLRRMGDFDAAREACQEALGMDDLEPFIEDMLRRQLTLIQQKDTAAHSMAELERPHGTQRVVLN
jgi:uncharacterized protein (DUF2225 family)